MNITNVLLSVGIIDDIGHFYAIFILPACFVYGYRDVYENIEHT